MFIELGLLNKNKWLYIVIILFFCLSIWVSIGIDNQVSVDFLTALLGFIPMFIFLYFIVKFIHNQSFQSFICARDKIDWSRIGFSFFLWGMIISIQSILAYILFPNNYEINFNFNSFIKLLITGLLLFPFQIGFEELFFRAYLMQGSFIYTKRKWLSWSFSSILFGLAHLSNPEIKEIGIGFILFYIFTGFILGAIVLIDNGLEIALGYHFANNLFSVLWINYKGGVFQTPSLIRQVVPINIDFYFLFFYIITHLIFLYFMYKKYHWKRILTYLI